MQAVVGFCDTAKVFPGTPADRARYLGAIGWCFADQADFGRIADQKGLADKLSATLRLLDRSAADDSPAVKAWFTFADAIITIDGNRREALRKVEEERRRLAEQDVEMIGASPTAVSKRKAHADPEPKPRAKKPKITPAFAPHKPGSDAALALLAQVDTALEAVQLADDGDQVPRAELQKHRDAVDQAAQRQLYLLDIALQTFRAISDRRARLDKALGPTEVDHAGSLLDALNVSFDSSHEVPDDSDVEFQDPSAAETEDPVVISEAS
ncbi:hypothetical protein C0993_012720 [Termitomyces sp. T159_Od127]|nr:hypothetical protein C0993_012720 [Termitomyces sp. T159_Od127]